MKEIDRLTARHQGRVQFMMANKNILNLFGVLYGHKNVQKPLIRTLCRGGTDSNNYDISSLEIYLRNILSGHTF